MVRIAKWIKETIQKKCDAPQRSHATKVPALTMMKAGTKTRKVSQELGVPKRTLQSWKKASIKLGNWHGPDGDSGVARPAPCKAEPGTGTKNRKMTEELKKKIHDSLKLDPFLTPFGLQKLIPQLRPISQRTIRECIQKELNIPSRLAAKKPF